MKKAKIRKVIISILISMSAIFIFSNKNYAANGQTNEIILNYNNNVTQTLGSEAGIYQTTINVWMNTERMIDSQIANSRTYYGAGEELKIRFSFSKTIDRSKTDISKLKMGIKFGNGAERVITNPTIVGSYLEFSYTIKNTDNGGLTLTFVEGSISDGTQNIPTLGLLNKENIWTNEIIAKGAVQISAICTNSENIYEYKISSAETTYNFYVLDGNKIRAIKKSDIYTLNLETGEKSIVDSSKVTIDSSPNTKNIVYKDTDKNKIIYIPNACDIAGNVCTPTAFHNDTKRNICN